MSPGAELVLLLALLQASGVMGVEIRNFAVPERVEYGVEDEVVLLCDYDYSDQEREGLVIMWYFNREVKPFLQWILGRKPQLIDRDRFEGHIDLEYTNANETDQAKMYNALRLVDPTPALMGFYTCKVSTLLDEDFQQKHMAILSTPDHIDLDVEGCNLTCAVTGVAPDPTISIIWGMRDNMTFTRSEPLTIRQNANDSNLFDASLSIDMCPDDYNPFTIICEVFLGEVWQQRLNKTTVRTRVSDYTATSAGHGKLQPVLPLVVSLFLMWSLSVS